jgi:hypothetical protein
MNSGDPLFVVKGTKWIIWYCMLQHYVVVWKVGHLGHGMIWMASGSHMDYF